MQNKASWLMLFVFIVATSCRHDLPFDQYTNVSPHWNQNQDVSYDFEAPDTITPHNLYIKLRTTNTYKYSNLYLIVELSYPSGKVTKDTLEYLMAKPNGELLGSGFAIKSHQLWYKGYENPFVFSELGNYEVRIKQAMRERGQSSGVAQLEGVVDVGFSIEKTSNQ